MFGKKKRLGRRQTAGSRRRGSKSSNACGGGVFEERSENNLTKIEIRVLFKCSASHRQFLSPSGDSRISARA
jgi:hypothetical protein